MIMTLKEFLTKNKSVIVERWCRIIFDSYPSDSRSFLRSQKDRFANPIGYAVASCTEKLFCELTGACDTEGIRSALSEFVRMRAVQEYHPSEAIGFILELKSIIRNEVRKDTGRAEDCEGLDELESGIDRAALVAFDLYMESREKLFQIRLDELRAKSFHETMWRMSQKHPT